MATLRVTVDDGLRNRAAESLAAAGLSVADAVRLLLERAAADRAFPRALRQGDAGELREHDCVRIKATYVAEEGTIASGQIGAIVHRYESGDVFEVEFTEPFDLVVTLRSDEIERA